MKDDYTTNSHHLTYKLPFRSWWELGDGRANTGARSAHLHVLLLPAQLIQTQLVLQFTVLGLQSLHLRSETNKRLQYQDGVQRVEVVVTTTQW